jgi:release factor glutamine methyltransferase
MNDFEAVKHGANALDREEIKVSELIEIFREAGIDNAGFEAKVLFGRFGGFPPRTMIFNNDKSSAVELFSAAKRRLEGEPLDYILGDSAFYHETYTVSPAVLIPRQDTEILVDFAVNNIPEGGRFLDLCTGSGCIAISTLRNTKNTSAIAVDISPAAVEIALKNKGRYIADLEGRLDVICADALAFNTDEQFDAILSNPPYIVENVYDSLQKEVKREPKIALIGGGDDGADFYRAITSRYKDKLKPGGFIAYEIGYDQAAPLYELAEREGMSCRIIKDYSGNDRVAVLKINH